MNRKARRQAQEHIKHLHKIKIAQLKMYDQDLETLIEVCSPDAPAVVAVKARIKKLAEEIVVLEKDFDNFEEQGAQNELSKTRRELNAFDSLRAALKIANDTTQQDNTSIEGKVAT